MIDLNKIEQSLTNALDNETKESLSNWLNFKRSNDVLDSISDLKHNWNDNGAEPISRELIQIIKNNYLKIPTRVEIYPTARNSIQLEYINESKNRLEVEIYENGEIEGYYSPPIDKEVKFKSIEESIKLIEKFIVIKLD